MNPWDGLKFEHLVKVLDLESVLIEKGVSGLPKSVTLVLSVLNLVFKVNC